MFKNFWENKKHIIEATGILTAIGALFLNINFPENEAAKKALMNIQMLWLFIISFMSLLLFLNFWLFAEKIEDKIEKKLSHDMPYRIFTIFVAVTGFWFLENLWKYLLNLYKKELSSFLLWLTFIPFGVAALIILYFENKFTTYYIENKKIKYWFVVFLVAILSGITYSFLFMILALNFTILPFIKATLISSAIALLACLILTYFKLRKYKKQHNIDSGQKT